MGRRRGGTGGDGGAGGGDRDGSWDGDWDFSAVHDDDFDGAMDGDHVGYVPVSVHRQRATVMAEKLAADGAVLAPVTVTARSISTSVWGQAWNRHLERYSDYKTRLPRGRSYLRNGYVLDLQVAPGRVDAKVQGAELYDVVVHVAPLDEDRWAAVCTRSHGSVASLFDVLQGKLADAVMAVMTDPERGIFPDQGEIRFSCTCLDWADLCKHAAAVLYGIGARLDEQPELLFQLRGVHHQDLMTASAADAALATEAAPLDLEGDDLGALFGIELEP